ncbi:3-hydroxyisobutyryl-CoA hydrolase [Coemansia sp. RSA 552]|nr:3-hydroxyisobutyryl-CoA hydrolase [Coemansia sp. RSA 552]
MSRQPSKDTAATRLAGLQRTMGTQATSEGDKTVLTVSNLTGRTAVLNRPKALNSLTLDMVDALAKHLQAWEASELVNVVMLRSNSPRAFCAGGDVVAVSRDWQAGRHEQAMRFFQHEYQVNHHIATYTKPLVAMLDGYTMGGGVGLSVHAAFRVASEQTVFAMPETKIGFFPDVGATFFLPRMDGETGTYLGLTGQQLRGRDLLYAGIATHYVPAERFPLLEQRLQGLGTADYDVANAAIEEFSAQPEDAAIEYSLAPVRQAIDRCFRFNTVESIIAALEEESRGSANAVHAEWAARTLEQLGQMSPSSLKLTLEQLRNGRDVNIQQAFTLELRTAEKRLDSHDMHEGIDALLVRKSNDAKWDPAELGAIDMKALSRQYFSGEFSRKLRFVHDQVAFSEYPHKYGLPTEDEVKMLVTGSNPQAGTLAPTQDNVLRYFDLEYQQKIGVSRKVALVLALKTKLASDGETLEWVDHQ